MQRLLFFRRVAEAGRALKQGERRHDAVGEFVATLATR